MFSCSDNAPRVPYDVYIRSALVDCCEHTSCSSGGGTSSSSPNPYSAIWDRRATTGGSGRAVGRRRVKDAHGVYGWGYDGLTGTKYYKYSPARHELYPSMRRNKL